jgi:hypothetical protein
MDLKFDFGINSGVVEVKNSSEVKDVETTRVWRGKQKKNNLNENNPL